MRPLARTLLRVGHPQEVRGRVSSRTTADGSVHHEIRTFTTMTQELLTLVTGCSGGLHPYRHGKHHLLLATNI